MPATQLVREGSYGVLDVLGPTVEFLTAPSEKDAEFCVMRGTIPPGVSVPLHSHADFETFFLLSGTVQVISEKLEQPEDPLEWITVETGQFIQVPGGAKHAFRNATTKPVVQLIVTTPKLGKFFQEIGRRVRPGMPATPPTEKELQRFVEVSARFGYWLGGKTENASIGISLLG
jgi:quercetin dioxygenase-like cupin family protein